MWSKLRFVHEISSFLALARPCPRQFDSQFSREMWIRGIDELSKGDRTLYQRAKPQAAAQEKAQAKCKEQPKKGASEKKK